MARRAGGMAFSCNWLFCMWPCVFFFGLLQLAINMHFRVTNAWQRLTGRNFLGSSSPPCYSSYHLISLPPLFFPFFSPRIPRAMQVEKKGEEKRNIYPRTTDTEKELRYSCTHTHKMGK